MDLKYIETTSLDKEQKKALLKLWNDEYPVKLTYASIVELEQYLQSLSLIKHLLLMPIKAILKAGRFHLIEKVHGGL